MAILGGLGEVRNELHMPAVLQMGPETRVEMDAGWADFLPKWTKLIGGEEHITCTLVVPEKAPTVGWAGEVETIPPHKVACPCGRCVKIRAKRAEARLTAAA